MISSSQTKRSLHSLLGSKLSKLNIPSSSSTTTQDLEFSDLFGPSTPSSQPYHPIPSSSTASLGDPYPQIIHNRSHSFLGPSPRYSPQSLPFSQELDSESEEDEPESMNVSEIAYGNDKKFEKRELGESVDKIGPQDFEILRVVGNDAFGKVFQVRKKKKKESSGVSGGGGDDDGDGIYAMKVMKKDTIINKNHVDYMKAERDILTKVVHPFIVQLQYSFQTKSKLYLILDFINGGHLFFHLYRQGIFSEDQARFYAAEIVMLTDFGLAKKIDESSRTNSMCGTTEYMAPEILLSKGHNKDADWWSVGILLYEMLTGQSPFTHGNRKKLQERILKDKVKLPPYLTKEAHSLLKGLLQKGPWKRLGSGSNGGDEIKKHKWFILINWKKLEATELLPNFKPDIIGKDSTTNFDKCWMAMPPDDSPAPTPMAGEHFRGYTYVAPNPWLSSG